MKKSVTIPLILSIIGTLLYFYLDFTAWKESALLAANAASDGPKQLKIQYSPSRDEIISVFGQLLNFTSISSLLYILYACEKSTSAAFGKVIRDNIGTVVLALSMSLIFAAIELVTIFMKV